MDKLLRNKKAIIIFMAPALLLFTFILFIPICQSVYYSFCDYNALTPAKWVGFKNYSNLMQDKTLKIVGTDTYNYTTQQATLRLINLCANLSSEGLDIEEFITEDTHKKV